MRTENEIQRKNQAGKREGKEVCEQRETEEAFIKKSSEIQPE
jgi:hypothetical protein